MQRKQHVKLDIRIKEVEKKKIEELHVQRHELEIQNVMTIIYILCMERLRSSLEMHTIHKHCEVNIYIKIIFDIYVYIYYTAYSYIVMHFTFKYLKYCILYIFKYLNAGKDKIFA